MKVRIPIYAKIALLFVANITVLAVALAWALHQGWGITAMPAFRSDKLERVVAEIFPMLEHTPLRQWQPALAEASQRHGITFYLYATNGARLGGPPDFLPGNIHSTLTHGDTGPPPRPAGGPRLGFPESGPGGGPDDPDRPPPPDDPQRGIAGETRGGPPPQLPRAFSDDPNAPAPPAAKKTAVNLRPILSASDGFWSLTRGHIAHADFTGDVALITRSDSPTGNGFYSDTRGIYWLFGALLLISVLVWLPFIHTATRSLRKMQATAGQLARGDFTARADDRRNDELGALGASVNHMADQIGTLVDGQKRLLGDIAHELNSPIARMQAIVGILETPCNGNRQAYIENLGGELQHMSVLVQELLSLSKANLRRSIELRPVKLRRLIERVIEREQRNGEQIILEVPDDAIVISEPELLSRAIGNVLRNAIRYAGDAGPITIESALRGEEILVTISDRGPGVPEASLPRLFDAFYRPDTARTHGTGGTGLGLAIVKSCIEATHGSVTVRNRDGGGLAVEFTLTAA